MARAFNGKRPDNLGHTLRTLFSYLGRHKGMIALVGVLAAVGAVANLLGTYMIKPIVNDFIGPGDLSGLVLGVAVTAAIYGAGALSTLGYTDHGTGRPKGALRHPPGPVRPFAEVASALF